MYLKKINEVDNGTLKRGATYFVLVVIFKSFCFGYINIALCDPVHGVETVHC